ncbi:PD-(D/E)XK nuclease family protein [Caldisphaera sp.]|uniref:PD-(D/E)XK nuclease family protein n=1 Tax=Caldisphaera sp. TaxID=2060322 RepID=UPI00397D25D5
MAIKEEFLRLLREDEEFRYTVAGFLGLDSILKELKQLREDFNRFIELENKRWEENNKKWEEANKRFEAIENELKQFIELENKRWEENNKKWEENNKRWEENNKKWEEANKRFEAIENELKQLRMDFNNIFASFSRRLDALGARWGIVSEQAFRNGMKGVVEKILGAGKVEKWVYRDDSGEVYGYPSVIEVDMLIKDGEHILIEIKSSISRGDVIEFWRKAKFYEKITNIKPKLIIISPYVDDRALEDINRFGIILYKET